MIIDACFPELCGFSITCNENSTLTLAHAHWGECANAYSKRSHHYVELALKLSTSLDRAVTSTLPR